MRIRSLLHSNCSIFHIIILLKFITFFILFKVIICSDNLVLQFPQHLEFILALRISRNLIKDPNILVLYPDLYRNGKCNIMGELLFYFEDYNGALLLLYTSSFLLYIGYGNQRKLRYSIGSI